MLGNDPMSQATFQIVYDGPALANHAMDVRQLGPALLAVGNLCREANYAINGQNSANVNVKVRANFDEGCFDITFDIVQFYRDVKELVRSEEIADAKTILEWIGLIGVPIAIGSSLFGFLKWKHGRKIERKERIPSLDGVDKYLIVVGGEDTIEIDAPVYRLFTSLKVRSAQLEVVDPLRYEGIDVMEVRDKGKAIMQFKSSELESGSFDILEGETNEEDRLESQIISAILILRAPVFDKGKKWQFWLGENRISTSISDEEFNVRVFSKGDRFGAGDRFDVKLSITQFVTKDGKIRNEYDIHEVVKVKRGPVQLSLLQNQDV